MLSNQEKITTFPSDIGSKSTLLDGIIELCLWDSLPMLQNFLCCTIPCKVWFLVYSWEVKVPQFFHKGNQPRAPCVRYTTISLVPDLPAESWWSSLSNPQACCMIMIMISGAWIMNEISFSNISSCVGFRFVAKRQLLAFIALLATPPLGYVWSSYRKTTYLMTH